MPPQVTQPVEVEVSLPDDEQFSVKIDQSYESVVTAVRSAIDHMTEKGSIQVADGVTYLERALLYYLEQVQS